MSVPGVSGLGDAGRGLARHSRGGCLVGDVWRGAVRHGVVLKVLWGDLLWAL